MSGGITAGVTDATGLSDLARSTVASDRFLAAVGRAGLNGAIQAASGGKFQDGFINSAMGSLASEVTANLDAHIAKLQGDGLRAGESSMLRLFSRAAGSALRMVGSGDPGSGFVGDLLGGILGDHAQGSEAAASPEGTIGTEATSGNAAVPGADPLGEFIAGNEQSRAERNAAQPAAEVVAQPSTVTVTSGDTLERIARERYGENWRAGLTAMVADNPGMTANRWGSPIIQPGQTLNTPSLDGLNSDQLSSLSQTGGWIVANNSQGLNVRAQWLAEQQARQAAAQQQSANTGGMTAQEAQDRYGGRSGSFARQMGEAYVPSWGGSQTDLSTSNLAMKPSARLQQLIEVSNADKNPGYSASELRAMAQEYRSLYPDRDSIYNGIWSKAVQARIIENDEFRQIDIEELAKFGNEYGLHAEVGGPVGAAIGSVAQRLGKRPIDLAQRYQDDVRSLYGDAPRKERVFEAYVNGRLVNGEADSVTYINGKKIPVESKYVHDWEKSLRNPDSRYGQRIWAVREQQKMIDQAVRYESAFGKVIYHTNSPELAEYYSRAFKKAGVSNFQFVITPAHK